MILFFVILHFEISPLSCRLKNIKMILISPYNKPICSKIQFISSADIYWVYVTWSNVGMQILRLNTVSFINIIKKISSTIEGISLHRGGGWKTVFIFCTPQNWLNHSILKTILNFYSLTRTKQRLREVILGMSVSSPQWCLWWYLYWSDVSEAGWCLKRLMISVTCVTSNDWQNGWTSMCPVKSNRKYW